MIGKKFGDYEVVEYMGKINPKRRDKYYKLKCSICGEERVSSKVKKDGFSTSYYHNNKICVNYFRELEIGKYYGDYIVKKFVGVKNRCRMYEVECVICKRVKVININHFHNDKGTSHQSCIRLINCYDKRFYECWSSMRKRTENTNDVAYKNYGGRGISSSDYEYFVDFYDDLFESYIEHCNAHGVDDTSIDRIDVDGNYTKDNIRWATTYEQNINTRRQKNALYKGVDVNGKIYYFNCPAVFAKEHGLVANYIYNVANGHAKSHRNWKFKNIEQQKSNDYPKGVHSR